jgi:hypothetical protein
MDTTDWVAHLGLITGLLGLIAGILALVLQGYDSWKKRRPRLRLFVPYCFAGTHAPSRRLVIFVLVRVSNLSERPAFLYLETLKVHLRLNGSWIAAPVLDFPQGEHVNTDFPDSMNQSAGIKYIKALNRFDSPVVALDNPYARYLGLVCDGADVKAIDRVRLEFQGCDLVQYQLEADVMGLNPGKPL